MVVRRMLLINIVLLLAIVTLSYNLYSDWREFEESRPLARIVARAAGQAGESELPFEYRGLGVDRLQGDFYTITANDLFHPDRRPPEAEAEGGSAREEAPRFPKDPEMQGVIESEGEVKALLTIFGERNTTNGESRIVGINDQVQGWTVTDITDTTTTLTWNDQTQVIDIFGSSSSRSASSSKTSAGSKAAVNIVKIGNRQSAVESTSVEKSSPGGESPNSGNRTAASSRRMERTPLVGTGGLPGRPTTMQGSRPDSSPD